MNRSFLTDGQKWFLIIVGSTCFVIFFLVFIIQSFSSGGASFQTPEQQQASIYDNCVRQAYNYTSGEAEIKSIDQCMEIYGR